MHQHTIKQPVHCQGIGLHAGKNINLTLRPAAIGHGVVFYRLDCPHRPAIPARVQNVVDTQLATTIASPEGHRVATTEHLLAALHGLGIDNVEIELDGAEVPIMDGSALPFVQLIQKAGLQPQKAARRYLAIKAPVSYCVDGSSLQLKPYAGFKISNRAHFANSLIDEQHYSAEITPTRFKKELAKARTFGFVADVEALWHVERALGVTLESGIAIHWDRHTLLNEEGLRFQDEFSRHKTLDILGDFALLGGPIRGHIIADCAGHASHVALMQALLQDREAYQWIQPPLPPTTPPEPSEEPTRKKRVYSSNGLRPTPHPALA